MMRPAMTILEVLVSLTLLGVLAVASLAWISSTQRGLAETSTRANWSRAAEHTLRLLHDELVTGDFREVADLTVRIEGGDSGDSISFRTRLDGIGPATVTYSYHEIDRTLVRSTPGSTRILLGDIAALKFATHSPKPGDSKPSSPTELSIQLVQTDGVTVDRRIRLAGRRVTP